MSTVSKDKLTKLIESHFHQDLSDEAYSVISVQAEELLTHTRLDLAFKLLYLEILPYDVSFSKEMYTEHIRAFSLGKFVEPGNEEKNSIDKFIEAFHATFEDIRLHGFDSSKTLIPLSKNGAIANGAHRVASAVFLNQSVECVALGCDDHIYDYQFFYKRNIPESMLDSVVTKFIAYAKNVYIAFIWPVANSNNEVIESIIPNIVYQKELRLNPNGAHNLLSQIYYGEAWLGTVENDFSGAKGKLVECFKTFDPVKVIAFQAENLDEVVKIKEKIRQVCSVGKHSVHITDTKEEAIRAAQMVFNENSIHFLNYAKPNNYISTHNKIDTFKAFLKQNNVPDDEVLLDASIVLSAYGLREAKDIDYLCTDKVKIIVPFEDVNMHDEVLQYYDATKEEMIFNPAFYFYFNGLKFMSFAQIYAMKQRRAEAKDKNDCKMIEALIENNRLKGMINRYKQRLFYGQILVKQYIIRLLQKTGLFPVAKKLHQKLKGNNA